jgi:hypothetical protein
MTVTAADLEARRRLLVVGAQQVDVLPAIRTTGRVAPAA